MNNLALDLIEYIKNDADQDQDLKGLYNSCMDALSDAEYLATLPDKFQDQKIVEDAWEICYAKYKLLNADYDDAIPKYLLKVEGIKEYFTASVLYEIEQNIEEVLPDNYEYIESDAIEKVIMDLTLENAGV